jgi:hypothetical protein
VGAGTLRAAVAALAAYEAVSHELDVSISEGASAPDPGAFAGRPPVEGDSGGERRADTSGAVLAVSGLQDIICAPAAGYEWPWPCDWAIAVWRCESESSGGWNAVNPVGHYGGFQVSLPLHEWRLADGESIFDPATNTRVAHDIWREQGVGAWPNCP